MRGSSAERWSGAWQVQVFLSMNPRATIDSLSDCGSKHLTDPLQPTSPLQGRYSHAEKPPPAPPAPPAPTAPAFPKPDWGDPESAAAAFALQAGQDGTGV